MKCSMVEKTVLKNIGKDIRNMEKKSKLQRFQGIVREISAVDLTTHASAITFFFFISMVPFFILAFALFPFTGITETQITELLLPYTPAAADPILADIVHQAYSASPGVYSVSILFIIWSSSQSTGALARALNAINHIHMRKKFYIRILLDILNTLIIIALLVYLLFMHSVKDSFIIHIEEVLSDIPFIHILARTTNYIAVFITAVLVIGVIYTVVPDGKRKYLQQLPGAACASLGWIIFSLIFRAYISGSNIYNSFYGSLAAAAIFLFWLYCCFAILLVGAIINRDLTEKKSSAHHSSIND